MRETSGSTEEGRIFSSLYESDSRVTRLPTVSLATSTESATSTTAEAASQHTMGKQHLWARDQREGAARRTIFSFRMYLDQDLLGAHDLDHLADIRARLLQQSQLFPEQAYPRVVVIALGF
jgi:hypothetical protein